MALGIMVTSLLCSVVAVQVIGTASAGNEAALLAFKAQVSDGGTLASWNTSTDFCSWEGVTCSHRVPMRVVELRLSGTGLAGALSPALGNLTFLRTLDLSFNGLHGEIPASLGRLHRLHNLILNGNSFLGTLPVNLSSCISMTNMTLDDNNLGGRIPAQLGEKLASLAKLSLINNSFTGPIPASLANLSHLHFLDLSTNHLVGSIPPGLGRIQSMRVFSLFGNNLSEYGEGSSVSTTGDIYSLGILLLEIFTGRSPTEGTFGDSLDLHKFVEDALPDRTLDISDPTMWLHRGQHDNTTNIRIQECLVSVFKLGLSCSKAQPRNRALTRDVAAQMHAIRDAYLKYIGEHGAEREASTQEIKHNVE